MNTAAVRVLVFITRQFRSHFGFDVKFFAKLADQRLLRGLARFYFAARKLPFEGVPVRFSSLPNQHAPGPVDDCSGDKQRSSIPHPWLSLAQLEKGLLFLSRHFVGDQLAQNIRKNSAAPVVFRFLRRVDASLHFKLDVFAVRPSSNHVNIGAGIKG
ncbi:MAG: hypothetical protein JWP08_1131 [Bryobacterales bacterium]|nr:hypothetical protein [Bryobacterales bacterium]